jgi:inorganic triphosphatase YgiF
MEIEAKYAITGPLEVATLEALDLSPYQLEPLKEEQHHDEVLDTPDRALTSKRQALRLRRAGGNITVTYKGPDTVSGGLHEREELEASFDAAALPGSYREWSPQIAERIEQSIGDAPLAPLVEMDVLRRTWNVLRHEQVIAELALDSGVIRAGGRTTPVHELEVELKGTGRRDDLEALDRVFSRALPLRPESQSKLERGLALLQA